MKINSINNQINFSRAILINTSKNKKTKEKYISTIGKVLNSEPSDVYNIKEEKKIRNFFKESLGDYNGENGISIRKIQNNDIVLLSGQDAEAIKTIETEKRKDSTKSKMPLLENSKNFVKNTCAAAVKEINKRLENGHKEKPESSFEILTPSKGYKACGIKYSSYNLTSNPIIDGHVDFEETASNKEVPKVLGCLYEELQMNI